MMMLMFLPLIIMVGMFGLFVWQAVWVTLDARRKGEEYWWIWTIASIVAFPIGLLVYVLVSKSDKSRCSNCGKDAPKNMNSCPYCGQKCGLVCNNCGQKVEAGWKFCPNCTTELPLEISSMKQNKGSDKKVIAIIVSIIIVVFLFFILSFIGMNVYNRNVFDGMVINEEVSLIESQYDAEELGWLGSEYDEQHTGTRRYNSKNNVFSINYMGKSTGGSVIIKVYDKNENLLSESKPLKGKKIEGSFMPEQSGSIIEIEYINFEGSFFFDF